MQFSVLYFLSAYILKNDCRYFASESKLFEGRESNYGKVCRNHFANRRHRLGYPDDRHSVRNASVYDVQNGDHSETSHQRYQALNRKG